MSLKIEQDALFPSLAHRESQGYRLYSESNYRHFIRNGTVYSTAVHAVVKPLCDVKLPVVRTARETLMPVQATNTCVLPVIPLRGRT
jgi:hypothetical protein